MTVTPLLPWFHLHSSQDAQLGNPRPMRKSEETEQAAQNRLFPGTFYSIPTAPVYMRRACPHTNSHTLLGYSVLRGPTLMFSEERETGLGQEGPVGASGIMQQPYFCQLFEQLGTSPGGRSP